MILKGAEISRYLARPDPTRPALLIYGQDAMRVALKRAEAVAALTGPHADEEMRLTRIPGADLRKDAALVLDAIAGYDCRDTTSIKRGYTPMNREMKAGVKGLRIGLPKEMFGEGLSADVRKAVMNAAKTLERLGATVKEVSIPSLKVALPAYYVLSSAEASSNLARFDGVRYGHRAAESGLPLGDHGTVGGNA